MHLLLFILSCAYLRSLFITKAINYNIGQSIILQSSVFDLKFVTAIITNLKNRDKSKENLFESDYSIIIGAILPYYFEYRKNWVLAPEIWSLDKRRSDFVLTKTLLSHNRPYLYGHSFAHLMVECKRKHAVSWIKLVPEQLWNQADSFKNDDGKLWVIGQIGFEICFFRFDVTKYMESETFANFSPLNLERFHDADLDYLNILHVTESVNNIEILQVIQWRLDDEHHHRYIHNMLVHISNNKA